MWASANPRWGQQKNSSLTLLKRLAKALGVPVTALLE